ncbi:hypothetical protein HYC85_007366 [Camellia sinensis]|uniref:Uncharacterized protein n=1 Tax=Camellia sinensis TaxID=4442 RepID=A0A7J7HNS6_CAMSI|nr:hypothetical protein HYC85_007366 [Camellia sinensis]
MASLPTQTILSLQILVLLIAYISGGVVEAKKQREFDYFALALQWPGTVCQRYTSPCCSSNACCRGFVFLHECSYVESFKYTLNSTYWDLPHFAYDFYPAQMLQSSLLSVNGLWPDYNDGTWPSCCTGSNFDIKEKVLNEAGYIPSNAEKYPLGGIITAIQNAFHATPLLVCSNGAVEELRLCFYKDFKPRDCVIGSDMLSSKSSCPKYVSLPTFVSLGLENGEDAFLSVASK